MKNQGITLKTLVLFQAIALIGCSATRTITDETVQRTTIQPVDIKLPDVRTEINVPLVKETPEEKEYVSEPVIIEQKTPEGTFKSKAIIRAKLKKDKPMEAQIQLTDISVKTEAKVTEEVRTVKSESTSFWYNFLWTAIKILFPLVVIAVLWFLFKEKIKALFKK